MGSAQAMELPFFQYSPPLTRFSDKKEMKTRERKRKRKRTAEVRFHVIYEWAGQLALNFSLAGIVQPTDPTHTHTAPFSGEACGGGGLYDLA